MFGRVSKKTFSMREDWRVFKSTGKRKKFVQKHVQDWDLKVGCLESYIICLQFRIFKEVISVCPFLGGFYF